MTPYDELPPEAKAMFDALLVGFWEKSKKRLKRKGFTKATYVRSLKILIECGLARIETDGELLRLVVLDD